ncbi:MAG: AraC family transcriptional regulator [Spirochaetales bacterium]|nr:AraC family transcriptional regulator [Spirochaetales bacterium]
MKRSGGYAIDINWRPLLRDLGVNPADVLRQAGLPEDLFARQDARLGSEEYFRLWRSVEAEIGDPLFPLRLADALTVEAFSPPLFAGLCSPNLKTAAMRISRYKPLIAPIALDVREGDGKVTLTFRWLEATPAPPASLVAAELIFFVALGRIATRETIRPVRVVTSEPPEPAAEYERFFGVGIARGDEHAVSFSQQDAAMPFLTANERMWETFAPDLKRRLADLDGAATVAERVGSVLLEFLPSGRTSMESISEKLIMSKRTLQRRLHNEGTTFHEVLRKTRTDLALHYLTNSRLTASEISFLLGFDDANSFFRAFSSWTGTTPESVRRSSDAFDVPMSAARR